MKDSAKKLFFALLPVSIVLAVAVLALSFGRQKEDEVLACQTREFSGNFLPSENQAYFDDKALEAPVAFAEDGLKLVLGVVSDERWIEVDLSEQKLIAHEGDRIFLESPISSGKFAPTPTGEFRVWIKLRYTKMEGGRKGTSTYYYLPNVPYVMYFENEQIPGWRGFGLHGTYWHNDFGRPRSHGCVNLPTRVAEKLYYWISPVLAEGKKSVTASMDNPGIKVVIHE